LARISPITRLMPNPSARDCMTAIVCGWQRRETTKILPAFFCWAGGRIAIDMVMASAAAVASSSMEALATDRPVRSVARVWTFSRDSRWPWLISG